jgi:hypothetical protein
MITGSCAGSEKLLGPVQEYAAPEIVLAVKLRSVPPQIGELLPAVGAPGVWLMTTGVVPGALGAHPAMIAETE